MSFGTVWRLATRLFGLWSTVEDLEPGDEGELPRFRTKIGRGYWEIGPFPVRRIR